jgi:Holliday junction DNA helicase RuvB
VGLKTIAVALGEEDDTIEDVYEPFLIAQGYVRKTSRGRVLGPRGYSVLNLEPLPAAEPSGQGALFS